MDQKIIAFVHQLAQLGRTDAIGVRHSDGSYIKELRAAISEDVIKAHLDNSKPIGIYLMLGTDSRIGVLDFDDHDGTSTFADVSAKANAVYFALIELGMKPLAFRSGGGRGIHLWVIFETTQPARDIRYHLKAALAQCGLCDGARGAANAEVEVFPKQDSVDTGGFGNLIALPLARESLPIRPGAFDIVPLAEYTPPNLFDIYSPDLPPQPSVNIVPRRAHNASMPNDLDEVKDALKHISADDYNVWIKVALALKAELGEEGLGTFDDWSASSTKYLGRADIEKRWAGLKPRGSVGVGTIFYLAQQGGWNGPSNPKIREMNARFGILTHGNKTLIILKNGDRRPDEDFAMLGVPPFFDRLRAEVISDSYSASAPRPLARYWFDHPLASRYERLDFDPSLPAGHNGRTWNMWQGFAYDPAPGSWALLQDHLFENISAGDDAKYNWLLNWLALGVQQPGEVIGTAIVLLGAPGVGKSFLADRYGALWGPHYTTVTHTQHVVGHFNSHLNAKRLIFVDEGMFGGNRKDAGIIKTRVTERHHIMEQKGVDPIRMRNRTIWMIASNELSVVPADLQDRRWMMLDVAATRRQDHGYFGAIAAEMDEGGYSAMLFDLLRRDITKGPDPKHTLKTTALLDQILAAQPAYVQFFYSLLSQGILPQNWVAGQRSTTVRALLQEYRALHPSDKHTADVSMGKHVNSIFPGVISKPNGIFIDGRPPNQERQRSTQYIFPPLPLARKAFERRIGQSIEWTSELDDWLSSEADSAI